MASTWSITSLLKANAISSQDRPSEKAAWIRSQVAPNRQLWGFKESLVAHSVLENNMEESNLGFYGNEEVILQNKYNSLQDHITGAKEQDLSRGIAPFSTAFLLADSNPPP